MASSVRISQLPESGNLADNDYLLVEKTDRTTKTSIGYMVTNLKLAKLTDYSAKEGAALVGTSAGVTVESAISSLKDADTTLSNSLSSLATRVKTNETDISALKNSSSANSNSLTALTSRVDNVETSITSLSDTSVQQGSDLVQIKSDISDVTTQAGNTATGLSDLTERVTTAEGSLSSVAGRVDTAETSITSLQTAVAATEQISEYSVDASGGYRVYSNGRTVAWGRSEPSSSTTEITFTRQFSEVPFDIQITSECATDTSVVNCANLVTGSVTATGFTVKTLQIGADGVADSTQPFRWKAEYIPNGSSTPVTDSDTETSSTSETTEETPANSE